ncbi:ABC transporter ATP-binding protein [Sneathiella sp.]|uniref:ABC transporter ATP-binding protein n=1 Tax=Sneathiella sp. TaxID=1964365 RepID=UPI002614B0CF|nr:ABC transporter ATP-binding protein [Sneathiella sp.]MDF2368207.1 ABC transporter ATP-binding protein [Sneathiella sp.]
MTNKDSRLFSRSGEAISLQNLQKGWGGVRAVDGIDLEIDAGSFTVLLGPSGCGKSTTLRLIAGLDEVDGGRILIGGKDVTDQPASSRDLSMVFQSYALFPHLSVAENIIFGLKVRRVGQAECEQRLQMTADLLGLSDYLDRRPSQLSGGQQQRVALGRAIISERPICLMDEPLSNLDAKLRHDMRVELRELQTKLGFTMVYVTHDQIEAISMADKVVLINQGKIEQAATAQEIYERPASIFTAKFMGTPPMNIMPASALLPAAANAPLPPVSDDILIGIRPEAIRVEDGGVKATIRNIEYLGADTLIDCRIGDAPCLVRVSGDIPPSGNEISLTWPIEKVHLFDPTSGRRIDLAQEKEWAAETADAKQV